jgi:acetyl-CoA synthetase
MGVDRRRAARARRSAGGRRRQAPLKRARMPVDRYAEIHRDYRWNVPPDFSIAEACCGRWASGPARLALHWEDESGATASLTYRELDLQANRLANALTAMGVAPGDKVALILPQRPETVVAHIAINRVGAVAVPLSFLFGPEALQFRLQDSETKVALVDPQSLPNLDAVRAQCPGITHVVGVAGARESWIAPWETTLEKGSPHATRRASTAADPAFLVYTSGTTGPPKGALMPQRCLIGNLPGFVHSHDGFPRPGDVFWSPADWAWTGGLMDALLPTMYFGHPIVGYRGRFDPEHAFALMEKYRIRNTFLFPTALKMMMKAIPRPKERFDVQLRSIMSAGEAVGTAVFEWAEQALGVTINEMFGQTEMNYIVGNSHELWPAKPGSMGRPYPGHRIAVLDEEDREVPDNAIGEVAVNRVAPDGTPDPVFFLEYFRNAEATTKKFSGDWCRTGDLAKRDTDGYLWYQGRADDMFKAAGYRIGPSEIENCLVRHPAVANAAVVPSPDETRGNVVKAFIVLAAGHAPTSALEEDIRQHVRKFLAPYEYPKEIEFIDALPMTTTGKVQRRVLRERERERKASATRQ